MKNGLYFMSFKWCSENVYRFTYHSVMHLNLLKWGIAAYLRGRVHERRENGWIILANSFFHIEDSLNVFSVLSVSLLATSEHFGLNAFRLAFRSPQLFDTWQFLPPNPCLNKKSLALIYQFTYAKVHIKFFKQIKALTLWRKPIKV